MLQRQPRGMQCLPLEAIERLNQHRTGAFRNATSRSINRIAHQRISDVSQVNANLMRTPALELRSDKRVPTESLEHPIVSHRIAPIRSHGHARALRAMAPNRLVD